MIWGWGSMSVPILKPSRPILVSKIPSQRRGPPLQFPHPSAGVQPANGRSPPPNVPRAPWRREASSVDALHQNRERDSKSARDLLEITNRRIPFTALYSPTYVRCRPARSARPSCDRPRSARSDLIRWPRERRSALATPIESGNATMRLQTISSICEAQPVCRTVCRSAAKP